LRGDAGSCVQSYVWPLYYFNHDLFREQLDQQFFITDVYYGHDVDRLCQHVTVIGGRHRADVRGCDSVARISYRYHKCIIYPEKHAI
jgi:hypothetical protein